MSELTLPVGGNPQPDYDLVVMFSGGTDSTVLLYETLAQGKLPVALHFAGLTSSHETQVCRDITGRLGVDLVVIDITAFLRACVPKRSATRRADGRFIFGNTIVFSMALAFALARGIPEVVVGLHQDDAAAYVENDTAFLDYIRAGLKMVGADCRLTIPYQNLKKEQVLRKGLDLGIDMNMTFSCMTPIQSFHDGTCDSCRDRQAAFAALGIEDPTVYKTPAKIQFSG